MSLSVSRSYVTRLFEVDTDFKNVEVDTDFKNVFTLKDGNSTYYTGDTEKNLQKFTP